jgi:ATP-dependent RNA helicase DeaD
MAEESSPVTFAQLGLQQQLVDTLVELGYEAPTPIQERTIPVLLSGRDLIGQAQTGTGKTAAFALPMLAQLDPAISQTQALVLAPTRELAMQVAEAIHSYARKLGNVKVLPVYGGAPIVLQMKHLQRGAQIVVGTPGRLIDHLDRKTLDLGKVRMVVLDEADEMLKMGFLEDVERILSEVKTPRQVALFSATMPPEVARIAQRHLVNAERVQIEHREMTTPAIEQRFLNLSEGQKLEVLTQLLELESSEAVLIFRRTKNGAAELAEKLEARGFAAVAMHGDMSQPLRESVIRRLRAGQIEIVVATDVAARGLDVEQISHVVNYDVPHDVEAYVHRIGRTGRAGRTGVATLFITPRERRMMREIERYTGMPIKPMKMPTSADVAARRISLFKDSLRKNVQEGDLDLYVELVEQLAEEGPYDMAEVAAAAARLANGSRTLTIGKADTRSDYPEAPPIPERKAPATKRPFAAAEKTFSDEPRAPRGDDSEKKVRLSMAVGKRDGIRPADVVGSIANEADVPGRDIGPIEIRDEITYVTVPERFVEAILDKVGPAKFRGRPVNIQVAGAGEAPRERGTEERRPPRRDSFAPPRREYGSGGPPKRENGGGAPKREYGSSFKHKAAGGPPTREGGAPPRREGGPPPRREYGARAEAPRRPFAAKSYGPSKGPRKPDAGEGPAKGKPFYDRFGKGKPPKKR